MFRCMNKIYYRGVQGVVLFLDRTNQQSFKDLESWLIEFIQKQNSTDQFSDDIGYVLMSNKSDLDEQLLISETEISQWCHDQRQ